MSMQPNTKPQALDPQLTAYVLGELPEDAMKKIKLEIENSESLQKEVQELKALSMSLIETFKTEGKQGISQTQKDKIKKEWTKKKGNRILRVQFGVVGLVAAGMLFAIITPGVLNFGNQKAPVQLARHYGVEKRIPEPQEITEKITDKLAVMTTEKLKGEIKSSPTSLPLPAPTSVIPAKLALDSDRWAGIQDPGTHPVISTSSLVISNKERNLSPSLLAEEGRVRGSESDLSEKKEAFLENKLKSDKRIEEDVYSARKKQRITDKGEATFLDTSIIPTSPALQRCFVANTPTVQQAEFNTETYNPIESNPFLAVSENPLSTFSIDVDTASYANMRRFILAGQLPPKDSVRIEEMINYFRYDYPKPLGDDPFSLSLEGVACPWKPEHQLLRIGIKGQELEASKRPACNLVFLVDVSGSMNQENKLPLLKKSLRLLVESLNEKDRVAIVVYAGSEGLALPSTLCNNKQAILEALDHLQSGGSTNAGAGIQLAYGIAQSQRIAEGNNRVILATDGDFNVGITNQGDLIELIEKQAKSGIFLSVLGYGMGNYKDSTLEKLADKGNGNYAYIDTLDEAKKVLVKEGAGTLFTIAKDVKIQVEFNPEKVEAYRLIGYENRLLRTEDFNNDKKDAGEIGAGHTVTALYEIVPKGVSIVLPKVDPLKYQKNATEVSENSEMLTVKLRYKKPNEDQSQLKEYPFANPFLTFEKASEDFKFTCAVAAFGMILRNSPYKATATLDQTFDMAKQGLGKDENGYRTEFLGLIKKTKEHSL